MPGLGLISAGLLALVWGVINGNDLGWGSPAGRRRRSQPVPRCSSVSSSGRRVRRTRCCRCQLLPQPGVQRGQRRLAADVLRDVRVGLPAQPVLPGRPGLQPVPGRSADAAVDGDADHRRPDRRDPRGPHRRAADPGHRDGAPGHRPRLAGRDRDPDRRLRGDGRAVHPRRHRHGPVLRARSPTSSCRRSARSRKARRPGATNTIREVGGVFGVAVLAAIFSANGGYTTPAPYVAGMQPAVAVGAVVVAFGAIAALFIPARAGRGRERCVAHRDDDEVAASNVRDASANPPRLGITHSDRVRGRWSRTLPSCHPSSATSRRPTARTCSCATGRTMRSRRVAPGRVAPWASVLLVHGIGEHSGRYEHVGDQMTAAGLEVAAYDHRGQGGSGGRRGDVERWSQFHDDLAERLAVVRAGAGDRPVVLYGHSLGGLIARWLSPDRPARARHRGPDVARPRLGAGRLEEALAPVLARVVPTVAIPTGIEGETLSRDPSVAARTVDDPLCVEVTTARFGALAGTEQKRVRTLAAARIRDPDPCPPRRGRSPRPGVSVGGVRGRAAGRATDLSGSAPRAPQRARGSGDHRRDHRVAATEGDRRARGTRRPRTVGAVEVQTPIG